MTNATCKSSFNFNFPLDKHNGRESNLTNDLLQPFSGADIILGLARYKLIFLYCNDMRLKLILKTRFIKVMITAKFKSHIHVVSGG